MKQKINLFLAFAGLLGLVILNGCKVRFDTEQAMYHWINDPENGLVKTRNISGLQLTMKYLPPEYLAFKELKQKADISEQVIDSLVNYYQNSFTFLLTIGPSPAHENNVDIMMAGIPDFQAYKQRSLTMNFNMAEYLSLTAAGKEWKPVLSNLENNYGLQDHRNIYMVFTPETGMGEIQDSPDLKITYNDELFHTGLNHFKYKLEDLGNIPAIKFWKI